MKAHIFNIVKANEIKEISITGKRWFQRSYGNTYHSVSVSIVVPVEVADRLGANKYGNTCSDVWIDLAYISDQYGYGRMFEQTALELLINSVSDVPQDWRDFVYICKVATALNVPYSENVYNVSRKKDL